MVTLPTELVYEGEGVVHIEGPETVTYRLESIDLNTYNASLRSEPNIDCLVVAIDRGSYTTEALQELIYALQPTYTIPRCAGDTRSGFEFLQTVAKDCMATRETVPKLLTKGQVIPLHH